MQMITYRTTAIPIKSTPSHDLLIANKHLADICFVTESLLDSTRRLHPSILYENKHYVVYEDEIFWSRGGIVRICLLLSNIESLEFADFIESL